MANFRQGLVSLVLSTSIIFGGCANFREGEIVAKKYQAPKKGTPIFGFTSPALLLTSIVLKLATKREEKFDNCVERYDFETKQVIKYTVNNRKVYESAEIGDWLIQTSNHDQYNQIKHFSNSINYPVGTRIELNK